MGSSNLGHIWTLGTFAMVVIMMAVLLFSLGRAGVTLRMLGLSQCSAVGQGAQPAEHFAIHLEKWLGFLSVF